MIRRIVAYAVWALAIAGCLFTFFWTGSALALAILIAVVVLPLAGWLVVRWASAKVGVAFEAPTATQKGRGIACVATVTNPTIVPFLRTDCNVKVNNLLTGQVGTQRIRVSVPPRSTVRVPFELTSDLCGRVECTLDSLVFFEPFSLFSCKRTTQAQRRLSVMPNLYETYMRNMVAPAPLSDTTQYSPYVKGSDLSEVFALREYEQGDDLRSIHWKLSEKIDKTVVREASLPIDNTLLVFWDKGLYGRANQPELGDAMAEVMLGVCQMLSHAGMSYEVASNDVATGRCFRDNVDTEEDIYELIGNLMSSPLGEVAESGLAAYTRLFGPLACSRLIYVCANIPEDLARIGQDRSLVLFVCDGASGVQQMLNVTRIHFAPGQSAHALELAGVA